MTRTDWVNLNGLWDYAITKKDSATPANFAGKILVPYPIESALSGVGKRINATQNIWYKKTIRHKSDATQKTLLHFGAVDNEATVYVNGKEMGKHAGGYTEFTFDITAALRAGDNDIIVKVFDPTDQGVYPHGKQVTAPANIYYTPSSGIWQTVWLEKVPLNYIHSLQFTPDLDKGVLNITVNAPAGYIVEINALDGITTAGAIKGKTNTVLKLPVKNAKLWSPDSPFLYDLRVKLTKGNKTIDEVQS